MQYRIQIGPYTLYGTPAMPMKPADRKAELVRRGKSISSVARELDVAPSHVNQVVNDKRRSPRVEQAIADAIEMPVHEVFEAPAPNGAAA